MELCNTPLLWINGRRHPKGSKTMSADIAPQKKHPRDPAEPPEPGYLRDPRHPGLKPNDPPEPGKPDGPGRVSDDQPGGDLD